MINSVVLLDLATEKSPPTVEVNLTSDGNRYGLAYLGKSARDAKMRHMVSMWLSSHKTSNSVKRFVLVQGAKGKVSYEARSGCHYWTLPQLEKLISDTDKAIDYEGLQKVELEAASSAVSAREESLMPGEQLSFAEIQMSQTLAKNLVDVDKRLIQAQRLRSILSKVVRHGDTQVVVPYWTPSIGGAYILHKCGLDCPKELRDYLLEVAKQRGPIWTQFFWRSLDEYPCPSHLKSDDKCLEKMAVWQSGKPAAMPLHMQKLVKEAMASSNLQHWDALRRGAFTWFNCIIAFNFAHGRKPTERVEYPAELGGRALTKSNKQTGSQRSKKTQADLLNDALGPINQAIAEIHKKLSGQDGSGGTETLMGGRTIPTIDSNGVERQIADLQAQIHALAHPHAVGEEASDDESSSDVPVRADKVSDTTSDEPEIQVHLYSDSYWYVATSLHDLQRVMLPLGSDDSLAELVMYVTATHPAFPSQYQTFPYVWLVNTRRAYIASPFSPPVRSMPTQVYQSETVFDLGHIDPAPSKAGAGKDKQKDTSASSTSSSENKSQSSTKKKSSSSTGTSKRSASSGPSDRKQGTGSVSDQNPLNVQNAPKSSGLTDEQKVALKKALGLPTEPIGQDVLAGMSNEERRKTLSGRSLPRWAVTAVLNNPANLQRIMRKELTKENFGQKAADRGTSAQSEWTALRQKFPGVALLSRPTSNKEKDLKKAWDTLVRKWGREAPGLPKPKGSRAQSSGESGGRGRSRQRAQGGSSDALSSLVEAVKTIGELSRAFSGKT
jgi:hypothetical protein